MKLIFLPLALWKFKCALLLALLINTGKVEAVTHPKTTLQEIKRPRSIIKKKGSVMGSVSMVTYGIPLDLNQFDDIVINLRKEVALLKGELREEGQDCEACADLEDLEKDIKRMKQPFEVKKPVQKRRIRRHKRPRHARYRRFAFMAAFAIGSLIFGGVATFFTIYSNIKTANGLSKLQSETNEVFVSGKVNSKKVVIFEEFQKNMSKIESEIVGVLSLEKRQKAVLSRIKKCHKTQQQLQWVVTFARHSILWPGIEDFTNLNDGVEMVKDHIKKYNYTLLLPTYDDLLKQEISYTVKNMLCWIHIHFKVSLDTTIHNVYQIQTFPILTGGKFLNIVQPKKLITVDESRQQFSLMEPDVFENCKLKFNGTKLCKNMLKLSNSIMNNTCSGALFNSDLSNVLARCGYTETKPEAFAAKIGEFKVAMYSPSKETVTCLCPIEDNKTQEIRYYPTSFNYLGTSILTVAPNCKCNSSLFEYNTGLDLSLVIQGTADKFEMEFNNQSMSMILPELSKIETEVDALVVKGDEEYEARTKVTQKELTVDFNDNGLSLFNIIAIIVAAVYGVWMLSLTFMCIRR